MNNISKNQIVALCSMSFFIGMLFFAWYHEMIIFRLPTRHFDLTEKNNYKKTISLLYLKDGIWYSSTKDMILTHNIDENCKQILQQLSNVLVEEKIIHKPIGIQDALYSRTQELYLSFAKNPFSKQSFIQEKISIIEAILATLRATGIAIKTVFFCVDHQPMIDNQLDFSKSWPIEGFIQKGAGI